MKSPLILIIRDGWGINPKKKVMPSFLAKPQTQTTMKKIILAAFLNAMVNMSAFLPETRATLKLAT